MVEGGGGDGEDRSRRVLGIADGDGGGYFGDLYAVAALVAAVGGLAPGELAERRALDVRHWLQSHGWAFIAAANRT